MWRNRELYQGPHATADADLQLGFENGYRISWQTALLGGMKLRGDVFKKNLMPWSGDHCSTHPDLVPGILFSNRAIPRPRDRPYHVRDIKKDQIDSISLSEKR